MSAPTYVSGGAPTYTADVKDRVRRKGVSRPDFESRTHAGDVTVVSNSGGARPVARAITTKSDLRTLCLERVTETGKKFSDVVLDGDRDPYVHLEITANARTDLAPKK